MAPLTDDRVLIMDNSEPSSLPKTMLEKKFTYGNLRKTSQPSLNRSPSELTLELRAGHQQLSDIYSELIGSIEGSVSEENHSPTLYACQGSLRTDTSSMLVEANLLLENVDEKRITSLRASLAQVRVDSYLETIQTALESRESFDSELNLFTSSIASQMEEEEEEKVSEDFPVRVSIWRTPSLCFDMEVGKEIEYIQKGNAPIRVRARAIAEVYAKDINAGSIPSYQACRLQIEELNYDSYSESNSLSVIGDVLVKVVISPMRGKKNEDRKNDNLQLRDCRVYQENAFPPLPTRTVDLFISTIEGTSDVTAMFKSKIYRMLNDDVPQLNVEFVMGGHSQ
mmetsp:Transcript_21507/g.23864  ORF Transcript_21507/g.23864 Transcript_21507/m.23864 type:complete len:339 (+) Transcript_21507:84-1100(+)